MTDYPTVTEVLAIHADQIERYGGADGVRDRGLLEAALYRPQTGYYADLIEEAADDQNQRPQILRFEGRRFFHEKLFLPPVPDGGQAAQIQKPFGIALKREIHRLFLFY